MYGYTQHEIETNTEGWRGGINFYAERQYMDDKDGTKLSHARQQYQIWLRRAPQYAAKIQRFYDTVYSRLDPLQKARFNIGQTKEHCVNPELTKRALLDYVAGAPESPRDDMWVNDKERK